MDWLLGNKVLPFGVASDNFDLAKTARDEIDAFISENNVAILGKKVLDVGMGRGNHLAYLLELGADAYGFDIRDYLDGSYVFGHARTFIMDIRDVPEELLCDFDIVIQYRYSSTPDVIRTVAKALKPDGKYIVTFVDGECGWGIAPNGERYSSSLVAQALHENFEDLKFSEPLFAVKGKWVQCIASKPRVIEKKAVAVQDDEIRCDETPVIVTSEMQKVLK